MISTQQIRKVFSLLEKTHPLTMLEQFKDYSAFQMLIATLLSARAKDSTTIPIVKKMFANYSNPKDYVEMEIANLEKMIYKIGFFRVKARNIVALSRILLEKYGGNVPDTFEGLTTLPGVGRKTANCMLIYRFGNPAIAVDVHVHRISNRLGWVKTKKPEETEQKLMKLVPKEKWIDVNRLLVGHGQTICSPVNPKCSECPVLDYCEFGKGR